MGVPDEKRSDGVICTRPCLRRGCPLLRIGRAAAYAAASARINPGDRAPNAIRPPKSSPVGCKAHILTVKRKRAE